MDMLLHVGLSNQMALRRRLDVVANNIANMGVNGFKGERIRFESYVMEMEVGTQVPKGLDKVDMVMDYGIFRSSKDGAVISTANPLDIALQGRGYFAVEDDQGNVLYSRNGKLSLNGDGNLVTPSGARVLDINFDPLVIGLDDTQIEISRSGLIRSENGEIGQINLVSFANDSALERIGDSLFKAPEEAVALPAQGLSVLQNALEGSNINGIKEITEMIQVQRSYQAMQRNMERIAEMRNQSIERLSRVT